MDWKAITEKMTPYVNKAKEYGQKAADFAESQIQTTPLFIKTQAEYDTFLTDKRAVLIAYDEKDPVAKEVQLLFSVWVTRAFLDIARLRFISISEFPELSKNIGVVAPIDMRVRFEGEETFRFTDFTEIKKWWTAPCYKEESKKDEDPLKTI